MKRFLLLKGLFKEQQGYVQRGKITGRNSEGILCRKYTWIEPALEELKDTTFEAFDTELVF